MGNVVAATYKTGVPLFTGTPSATEYRNRHRHVYYIPPHQRIPPEFPPELSKGSAYQAGTQPNDPAGRFGKCLNPGTFEDWHKKVRDLQPAPFGGANVQWNKCLTNHLQMAHLLRVANQQERRYRFGITYVGHNEINPNDCYPVLLGDIDPLGNWNAAIIHQPTEHLFCRLNASMQGIHPSILKVSSEYRGDDFTAALALTNPNLIMRSAQLSLSCLKALTPRLDCGVQLNYCLDGMKGSGSLSGVELATRYSIGNASWAGLVSRNAVNLSYYQRATPHIQLGVELETNLLTRESVASLSYQAELPASNMVYRASVDTDWNICGVLEKRLDPLPFTFFLSGYINHARDLFRLGVGMSSN